MGNELMEKTIRLQDNFDWNDNLDAHHGYDFHSFLVNSQLQSTGYLGTTQTSILSPHFISIFKSPDETSEVKNQTILIIYNLLLNWLRW